jgi:threonine/homoserine/homoserine lactone efflux protein
LFHGFWLELPSSLQVDERVLIAGGAVGFHFYVLLPPGNDDIAGVPTSMDDGMKVARGVVVEITTPLLVHLDGAVPVLGALHDDEPAAFLLDVICIVYLDVG